MLKKERREVIAAPNVLRQLGFDEGKGGGSHRLWRLRLANGNVARVGLVQKMRLPWTVTSEPADDPDEFVVRVKELPGTVVIGTAKEIEAEFWDALRLSSQSRIEFGDAPKVRRGIARQIGTLADSSLTAALSQPVVFS